MRSGGFVVPTTYRIDFSCRSDNFPYRTENVPAPRIVGRFARDREDKSQVVIVT